VLCIEMHFGLLEERGHPLGMVVQVRDSLDRKEADLVKNRGRELQFTYGYLSSSSRLSVEPTQR